MAVDWVKGDIAGGKGTFGVVDDGIVLAIFRQWDGSVWFSAALPKDVPYTLDRTRLPILWVDGEVVRDAGDALDASYKAAFTDPPQPPHHMADEAIIGFRLWDGDEAQGLGAVGAILQGKALHLRYFVVPHQGLDLDIPLEGVAPLLRETLKLRRG
jgi:hypothetical protein